MIMISPQPFLAILLPVIGSIAIRLINENSVRLRNTLAVATISLVFIDVASMMPTILNGGLIEFRLIQIMENVGIFFRVDALGMVFGMVASALWVMATIYSIGYMAHEHNQKNYFVFFVLSCSAAMGVALQVTFLPFIFFTNIWPSALIRW